MASKNGDFISLSPLFSALLLRYHSQLFRGSQCTRARARVRLETFAREVIWFRTPNLQASACVSLSSQHPLSIIRSCVSPSIVPSYFPRPRWRCDVRSERQREREREKKNFSNRKPDQLDGFTNGKESIVEANGEYFSDARALARSNRGTRQIFCVRETLFFLVSRFAHLVFHFNYLS